MFGKVLFAFFVSTFLFFVDRITKSIFSDFLGVCNRGVAFGLFENWGFLLTLAGVFFFFSFLFFSWRGYEQNRWFFLGLGIFLAGAVSNILDRIYFGCVRDVFDFFGWFVFNISDGLLFIGAFLVLNVIFFGGKKKNLH
jgi:signal peptidase II